MRIINNNSLDYIGTKAVLYLPFIDSVELDLDYVIGQTISITYKINLVSGQMICQLHSSKDDSVFRTITNTLGLEVPYTKEYFTDSINGSISTEVYNDVKQARIELVINNTPNIDSM